MSERLKGRIAVVTGSSSGNGRAIALALAAEGATVVCSDLRREPRPDGYEDNLTQGTDQFITDGGGTASFVETDVSDPASVEALVTHAVDTYGRIDVMVNNAGYFSELHTIIDETVEQYDRTMDVNAKGVWLGCKYAITAMAKQDPDASGLRGRVINIASVGGIQGAPAEPAYCASKGAAVNLTRQLALDFGPAMIAVNAICPGPIETGMVREWLDKPELAAVFDAIKPWAERGKPIDIARSVVYLASDDSSFVHGSIITVDGGMSAG